MKIELPIIENWKEKVINTEILVAMYGEEVLNADFKGDSLLHIAIKLNDKHLFSDLLKRKTLPFYKNDINGLSPLRLAITKKREKMARMLIKHPEFDLSKEKKSDINDFLFEKEIKNRNYMTKNTVTRTEDFYSMTDEHENAYKPSLLSLLLLNNMPSLYKEIVPFLEEEELSSDLSLCFEHPGFSTLSYKDAKPVSIFEIALYSNQKDVATSIFKKNPEILKNLLTCEKYEKTLLFYTSKDTSYMNDCKVVLKNYPLHNLLDMFIYSDFIKNTDNIRLKNSFLELKSEVEGNFFTVEEDFRKSFYSSVEQFIILSSSQQTQKIDNIKRKRM